MAISEDPPEKSREMAEALGIEFPLLQDADLALAKQYSGLSTDGFPFPAVFVIGQDGQIVFQEIATRKDKRIYAAELIAIIDRNFGTSGTSVRGYKKQTDLRLAVSGGSRVSIAPTARLQVAAVHKLGEHLALGLELGAGWQSAPLVQAAALGKLRWPVLESVAELYAEVPIGIVYRFRTRQNALYFGARVGVDFAWSPSLSMFADLDFESIELDSAERQVLVRFGVARKF